MSKESCQTCRFWGRLTPDVGLCRRQPPVMTFLHEPWSFQTAESEKQTRNEFGDEELPFGDWPHTQYSDWCGEYQEAEPDAPIASLPPTNSFPDISF